MRQWVCGRSWPQAAVARNTSEESGRAGRVFRLTRPARRAKSKTVQPNTEVAELKRELYEKLKNHPARELLKRAATGNMPSDDEFASAAGDDPEKAAMLTGAAGKLDEQRRANEGMRGRVDAVCDADRFAAAYVALHDAPEPSDELSADEEAELAGVAERIKALPWNRFG